jgi:hypothetical protein
MSAEAKLDADRLNLDESLMIGRCCFRGLTVAPLSGSGYWSLRHLQSINAQDSSKIEEFMWLIPLKRQQHPSVNPFVDLLALATGPLSMPLRRERTCYP